MPLFVKETLSNGKINSYQLEDIEYAFITDSFNQEILLTLKSYPEVGGEIETRDGKKFFLPCLMENSSHLLHAINFPFVSKSVEVRSISKENKL